MNNAQFFLYLAEHGKSFAPHTPKRRSDQIGLFRAICTELIRMKNQGFAFWSYPMRHAIPVMYPSPLARLRILLYFEPIMGRTERLLSRVLAE